MNITISAPYHFADTPAKHPGALTREDTAYESQNIDCKCENIWFGHRMQMLHLLLLRRDRKITALLSDNKLHQHNDRASKLKRKITHK